MDQIFDTMKMGNGKVQPPNSSVQHNPWLGQTWKLHFYSKSEFSQHPWSKGNMQWSYFQTSLQSHAPWLNMYVLLISHVGQSLTCVRKPVYIGIIFLWFLYKLWINIHVPVMFEKKSHLGKTGVTFVSINTLITAGSEILFWQCAINYAPTCIYKCKPPCNTCSQHGQLACILIT